MKGKGANRILWIFLIGILFSVGCLILQNSLVNHVNEKGDTYIPEKKDLYNGYGLEGELELSATKIRETDKEVVYEDRVFNINSINLDGTEYAAEVAAKLKAKLPKGGHVYVMPIPERAAFETGYENDKKQYEAFARKMQKADGKGVTTLNPLPLLEEHKEEYIYCRSENSWTMRGAFYGAQTFRKALGYTEESLEDYRSYVFGEFGNETITEPFYIFIKGDNPNRELMTYEDENDEIKTIKKSTIQFNSAGSAAVIGNSYMHSVVDGCGEGSLLLINDQRGKFLISYLAEMYEKIYVVNIYEDKNFAKNMDKIVSKYDIKQVIWAQNVSEMGDPSYMRALNAL